jgi:hypothetical protein
VNGFSVSPSLILSSSVQAAENVLLLQNMPNFVVVQHMHLRFEGLNLMIKFLTAGTKFIECFINKVKLNSPVLNLLR